jgi:ribosomal protein L11 methyltransferase
VIDPTPRTWPAIDIAIADSGRVPPDASDRLALLLDDLDPIALDEAEDAARWRVYFADGRARDSALAVLRAELGTPYDVRPAEIEDEGWVHKVQEDLKAVRVGRIVVAPPWDVPDQRSAAGGWRPVPSPEPRAPSPEIVIVIEPSMGFGTGHHQSTRLCLEALQALPLAGLRVIDVGTGSGVLALVAARLGAVAVTAIDNDPDSIAAAVDNAARNGLAGAIELRLGEVGSLRLPPADVVVANLTAWILRRDSEAIVSLVASGGCLVTSGFTRDQVPLVTGAFAGLRVESQGVEDDWVSLTLRRGSFG